MAKVRSARAPTRRRRRRLESNGSSKVTQRRATYIRAGASKLPPGPHATSIRRLLAQMACRRRTPPARRPALPPHRPPTPKARRADLARAKPARTPITSPLRVREAAGAAPSPPIYAAGPGSAMIWLSMTPSATTSPVAMSLARSAPSPNDMLDRATNQNDAERGGTRSLLALGLSAVATALAVGAIWAVPYLPTNDGPHHVLLAYLWTHLAEPDKAMPPSCAGAAGHELGVPRARRLAVPSARLEERGYVSPSRSASSCGRRASPTCSRRSAEVGSCSHRSARPRRSRGTYTWASGVLVDLERRAAPARFVLRRELPTRRDRWLVVAGLLVLALGHSFVAMLVVGALIIHAIVRFRRRAAAA